MNMNMLASFLELIHAVKFNSILILLLLCSFVAIALFIERLMTLSQAETDSNELLIRIRSSMNEGSLAEAVDVCEVTRGPIAAIVRVGLLRAHHTQSEIEKSMQIAAKLEIAKLEKNTRALSLVARIAPLIGLLGTVLGFIQAFGEMRLSGLVDISTTQIGEAMEYALITTAFGLVVAIPSILAYNYLVSRIESFVLEMETTSSEVVELLTRKDILG